MLESAREAVADLGRRLVAEGLTAGTGGNVSVRAGDRVAISPSGVPYDEIDPGDVPVLALDGERLRGEDPSSEAPMHLAAYAARDGVGGIVHTHSPYATTFAVLREPIPASHYLLPVAGPEVPVADYATFGTGALGEAAVEALGDDHDACLLANHGVLAVGDAGGEALRVARLVEQAARIHHQARAVGDPVVLPDGEVERLRARLRGGTTDL